MCGFLVSLRPLNSGTPKSCPPSSDLTPGWCRSCPSFSVPSVDDWVWATSFLHLPFRWPSVLQVAPPSHATSRSVPKLQPEPAAERECVSRYFFSALQSSSGPPWSSRPRPNPSAYPSQSGPSAWPASRPAISHGRLVLRPAPGSEQPGPELFSSVQAVLADRDAPSPLSPPISLSPFQPQPMCPLLYFQY